MWISRRTPPPTASTSHLADGSSPSNISDQPLNEAPPRANQIASYRKQLSCTLSPQDCEACNTVHREAFQGTVSDTLFAHHTPNDNTTPRHLSGHRFATRPFSFDTLHATHSPAATESAPLLEPDTLESRPKEVKRIKCFEPLLELLFEKLRVQQNSQSSRSKENLYKIFFRHDVRIECNIEGYPTRVCKALFDPICDHNLISRHLADEFYDNLQSTAPRDFIQTLGGVARAIGEPVSLCWAPDESINPANPRFIFPDRYIKSISTLWNIASHMTSSLASKIWKNGTYWVSTKGIISLRRKIFVACRLPDRM